MIKKRFARKLGSFIRYHEGDGSMQATIERLRGTGMNIGVGVVIYD